MYAIDEKKVAKQFKKEKVDPDTDAIKAYQKEHNGKLPVGVRENEDRGEKVVLKESKD